MWTTNQWMVILTLGRECLSKNIRSSGVFTTTYSQSDPAYFSRDVKMIELRYRIMSVTLQHLKIEKVLRCSVMFPILPNTKTYEQPKQESNCSSRHEYHPSTTLPPKSSFSMSSSSSSVLRRSIRALGDLFLKNCKSVRSNRRNYHLVILGSHSNILHATVFWVIKQGFDLSDTVIVQLGDVVGVMHGSLVIHRASNYNAIAVENDVVFEARCILQVLQDSVHLIDLIIGHDERERCVGQNSLSLSLK